MSCWIVDEPQRLWFTELVQLLVLLLQKGVANAAGAGSGQWVADSELELGTNGWLVTSWRLVGVMELDYKFNVGDIKLGSYDKFISIWLFLVGDIIVKLAATVVGWLPRPMGKSHIVFRFKPNGQASVQSWNHSCFQVETIWGYPFFERKPFAGTTANGHLPLGFRASTTSRPTALKEAPDVELLQWLPSVKSKFWEPQISGNLRPWLLELWLRD